MINLDVGRLSLIYFRIALICCTETRFQDVHPKNLLSIMKVFSQLFMIQLNPIRKQS